MVNTILNRIEAEISEAQPVVVVLLYTVDYEPDAHGLRIGLRSGEEWLIAPEVCDAQIVRTALNEYEFVHYLLNDESAPQTVWLAACEAYTESQKVATCTVSDALDFIVTELAHSGALGYVDVTIANAKWRVIAK